MTTKKRFVQLVIAVSDAAGIKRAQIEKDYFVTMFLSRLKEKEPISYDEITGSVQKIAD